MIDHDIEHDNFARLVLAPVIRETKKEAKKRKDKRQHRGDHGLLRQSILPHHLHKVGLCISGECSGARGVGGRGTSRDELL